MADRKWAAFASQGPTLTTELNSLGNGSYSAPGMAIDNTTNKHTHAFADIVLASLNPTDGGVAYLDFFFLASPDGSTYEDAPASTNPGWHVRVRGVPVDQASSAKRVVTAKFPILPLKYKGVLLNSTGVSLGASGNTVTIYTGYETVA